MNVWSSAFEIYSYSKAVPEVVGSPEEVIRCGIEVRQQEATPPPRCREVGYTPLEWMRHWVRALGRTILRAPAEPYRQECMSLIRNRLSGRGGERHVQS